MGENCITDRGASIHGPNSADILSDVQLRDDEVSIGDNHLIDGVRYSTLTVVFPRDLTAKLLARHCVQPVF